jgi:hypothetical protein
MRPYLKKTLHKNRAVGVAEGEASALSSNPSTAKKKKKKKMNCDSRGRAPTPSKKEKEKKKYHNGMGVAWRGEERWPKQCIYLLSKCKNDEIKK